MKQTDPQYKLRLPEELKQKIEEAAVAARRSMNAEIVSRLQASFTPSITTSNVKFSLGAGESEADVLEQATTRFERAAVLMLDAHIRILDERLAGLTSELAATEGQANDLQRLVLALSEELSAIDDDVDSLTYRRLKLQEANERTRLLALERRIAAIRSAIEQTKAEIANTLREARAKPAA